MLAALEAASITGRDQDFPHAQYGTWLAVNPAQRARESLNHLSFIIQAPSKPGFPVQLSSLFRE